MSRPAPIVTSVNVSGGGIPKTPVTVGRVTPEGIAGDAHDHEKHNTPLQALSLIDGEDLDDLAAEGFPVTAGATGENVTARGLDVDGLAIGDRLRFSGGVTVELTKRRKPCYVLDAIDPRLKEVIAGRCGFYARVLTPGELRPGETIGVERGARMTAAPDDATPTGVILAGGVSRRMGTAKHALVTADGRRLIDVVAAVLAELCPRIIVSGALGADACPWPCVPDVRPDAGPLAGIEAVLASGIDDDYLLCPCDQPRLTAEALSLLLTRPDASLTVLHVAGEERPRPLPARLTSTLLPAVRALLDAERRAVHGLLDETDATAIVEVDERFSDALTSVNTPAEWERYLRS